MRPNSTLPVCLLAFGWMKAEARMPEPETALTVRLYDYAHVPPGTLAEAKNQAIQIFRQAGVDLRLVACGLTEEENTRNPACRESLHSFSFDLRILPREMAQHLQCEDGTLGFATPGLASVSPKDVQVFSALNGVPQSVLLGHVMAHELGHLLLGKAHTLTGLMSLSLRKTQLARAVQGPLLFHPQEAQRIRAQLQRQAAAAW